MAYLKLFRIFTYKFKTKVMKNIHVLPTNKPTWLHKSILTGILRKSSSCIDDMKQAQGVNIYITSDEEIKEGNAYLTKNGEICKSHNGSKILLFNTDKKIILTTDVDLIKNGVQAIDDEFLEWFVKHPSCERVEVKKECCGQCDERLCEVYDREIGWTKTNTFYKIIIPKEEPTFENSIDNTMNIMSIANSMFGKKEEPKQETLEEASSRCAIQENKSSLYELGMKYFQLGAKWQAERMYSEEEVLDIFFLGRDTLDKALITKDEALILIEQFKKK